MDTIEIRKSIRSPKQVIRIKEICLEESITPTEYVMGLVNQDIRHRDFMKAMLVNGAEWGISDTYVAQILKHISTEFIKNKK